MFRAKVNHISKSIKSLNKSHVNAHVEMQKRMRNNNKLTFLVQFLVLALLFNRQDPVGKK
jgi:hypothetical protein